MKKLIFFVFLIVCSCNLIAQQKYINVAGTSELILRADQINFTVNIRVVSETIKESKQKNDVYVNQLLQILKDSGINSDDIEVSPITMGRNYEYDGRERTQNGYYTQVRILFVLKVLSGYYNLTDKLTVNDNFEIINAHYDISDYEVQNKTAYETALRAAKKKAEYMSKTLGLELGDVLEIDEFNKNTGYPNPMNSVTRESNQVENPTGNVIITRSIRVKFALK